MPRMPDGYNFRRKQQRKWTMHLGIWNVQGLRNKQQEIMLELIQRKIDIAILSETKKKGSGTENIQDFIHIYTGVDKHARAKAGVSIIIHKKYKKHIKSYQSINERVITLTLNLRGRAITILGIYAPTDDSILQEKDSFEDILRNTIDQIPRSHEIVIAGDLNGRVGRQTNSKIVGMHGEEAINDNGHRWISLCSQYDFKITNTFFAHKDIHKYTWYQHTRGLKSIIDYLIVRQRAGIKIQDVRAMRGADCGSDHCLVVSKIYIPYIANTKYKQSGNEEKINNIKYNLESLDHDSVKYLYCRRLDEKLCQGHRTTEEEYEHIRYCIVKAVRESLGIQNNKRKPYWWDTEIEQQIKNKKELYKKVVQRNDLATKEEYKRLNRIVKREVVKKKNESWMKKCTYIDQNIGGTRSSEAWKTIKSIRTSNKQSSSLCSITSKEWVQYYQSLLTENRPHFKQQQHQFSPFSSITLNSRQVEEAIAYTKLKKSPGPGGIHPEFIKYGSPKLKEMLRTLYERCLNGEETPKEWRTSYISNIHKKGSKNEPKNYRGIAVIPTIGRIYSRILKNLIEQDIEHKQSEEQSGFRAGRSTIDNLFTLKIALEKRIQRNMETHIALIDLEKAYDSVPISQLWLAMEQLEIRPFLIQAVQRYYIENEAAVKIGNVLTETFVTSKGLRQGCCLSPTLFKIYLDQALQGWKHKCRNMGLQVGDHTLYTLFFADDQVVLAEDELDLNYMIRKLQEEYEKAGLCMNLSKCEYLAVGNDDCNDLSLHNCEIKGVSNCKYLGVILNKNGTSSQEIQERINKGRQATAALNSVLWDKDIRKGTKLRIYRSIVQSVLTYGAEVWDLSKTNRRKLLATEMDFLRRSSRLSRMDHVRNETIRRNMVVEKDIVDEVEKKQLTWFGHTKRMNESRWPRKILEWVPQKRRKRGRPRRSWRDDVNEAMTSRNLEENMCYDRGRWKLGTERRRQP